MHPGMKPPAAAQPARRGFTAAQLHVSSSDDEADLVEGDFPTIPCDRNISCNSAARLRTRYTLVMTIFSWDDEADVLEGDPTSI